MTTDQLLLFGLFGGILALLLSGRARHDLVAASGLLVAVLLGLVPAEGAFLGFANHAVIIVALVLVASRAFENAGVLTLVTRRLGRGGWPVGRQIAILGGIGAALSAVINNVAALALLMPLDIQSARARARPPSMTLMPLSFATILGGMVTLIGTPPNIIAAAVREERLGDAYGMFDFAPVGLAVASAGLVFIALLGWRLVPRRADPTADLSDGQSASSFHAELVVPESSKVVSRLLGELDREAERADVLVLGLIRDGQRYYARAGLIPLAAGDILIVEGAADGIAGFIESSGLRAAEQHEAHLEGDKAAPGEIVEAVVRADSRLVGISARMLNLRHRFAITLLAIARGGVVSREAVRDRRMQPGDVLLLGGRGAASPLTLDHLGLLAVNKVEAEATIRPWRVVLAVGLFAIAIFAASVDLLSFTIALAIAVTIYAAVGLVPAREFYHQIDWSVIVMLGCLLPIGSAFEDVGGTALIAEWIAQVTAGYGPVVALVALMVVVMTLSDVLNNVATMVISGPIALDMADRLEVNPDTFLMGVAVACSCAFLTPIGHKNNTLIMGPGGFRFSDYWRMGLPLEIVVLTVGVPVLLVVWPLAG